MHHYWTLVVHHDGQKVVLYKLSTKNRVKQALGDAYYALDTHVFRGWLSGERHPDIVWNIPLGKPSYEWDDDDQEWFLTNSVAQKAWQMTGHIISWTDRDLEQDKAVEVAISAQDAIAVYPDVDVFVHD